MTHLETLRRLYVAETPEDFVQRNPPPERQPLPGEKRHRPISEDIKAMRESQRLGLIVGQPWTNAFRKLMSDDRAMLRLKESYPVRWALVKLTQPGPDFVRRRERLRTLVLYLGSNYEPDLIAALQGRRTADVRRELEKAAGMVLRSIGPMGARFLAVFPDKVVDDLKARGVA